MDLHIDFLDDVGMENPDVIDWPKVIASSTTIIESLPLILKEVEEELSTL